MQDSFRILAIDFGQRRIGLAVSDPLGIFATPLKTISNDRNTLRSIEEVVEEYQVSRIVVGLPVNLDGSDSDSTRAVRLFIQRLQRVTDIEIVEWDERFTSKLAEQTLIDMGVGRKKRRQKHRVDMLAAVHLLQSYLQSLSQARK
ncbi:MAG: Holliday junction resolvase RuvX [Chlorobi bacterium]|nr:Holliday junction resolvase RuvX [Chlorobiota bacterium]